MTRLVNHTPVANKGWSGDDPDPSSSYAPFRLYNIGNNSPVKLMDFIDILEQQIGIEAKKKFLPMQPGDVYSTFADTKALEQDVGFKPNTSLDKGLGEFIHWYRDYYKMGNGPA